MKELELTHLCTAITDEYQVDVRVEPTPHGRYRAAHIHRVTVRIEPAEDDPGQHFADVTMTGYELTRQGFADQRMGRTTIYGERDAQDRYDLVRAAVLASCERHGIDPATVDLAHSTETWEEYKGRMAAYYQDLGVVKS